MRINGVSKQFDGVTVLPPVSAELPERGVVMITGRSGAGKTTLLRILAGLTKPDSGSVELGARRVSMVFQEDRLLPWETALDNAAIAGDRSHAMLLLTRMGLEADAEKLVRELSGGMQRRTAIARALAFGGEICIMDEPLKGLDEETREQVLQVILDELRGGLLIMVTHDPGDLRKADLVLAL